MEDLKEIVKNIYIYIKTRQGLVVEKLINSDSYLIVFEEDLKQDIKEEITEEWLFYYLAFQVQNQTNYLKYKGKPVILYLSSLCTKKGIYFYNKKQEQYWRFFVERDLFLKYKFDYNSYLKSQGKLIEEETVFKTNGSGIFKLEEKERQRFEGEAGFNHCINQEIFYSKDSLICNVCKFKIQCQKRD